MPVGSPRSRHPSPFWVNRYFGDRPGDALAEEQLLRLDELGIAPAPQALHGEPEHAVVEALLEQAVRHISRISARLNPDSAASANLPASTHSGGCLWQAN